MAYDAKEIANYIINKCYEENKPVSNLQLQKLLYFMWTDYYRRTGKPLFTDNICAWQLGPVVPGVYYEYCAYGGRPINIKCETQVMKPDADIMDEIIDQYIDIPVSRLVNQTHTRGGAWDFIYADGAGNRRVIPFDVIRERDCKCDVPR